MDSEFLTAIGGLLHKNPDQVASALQSEDGNLKESKEVLSVISNWIVEDRRGVTENQKKNGFGEAVKGIRKEMAVLGYTLPKDKPLSEGITGFVDHIKANNPDVVDKSEAAEKIKLHLDNYNKLQQEFDSFKSTIQQKEEVLQKRSKVLSVIAKNNLLSTKQKEEKEAAIELILGAVTNNTYKAENGKFIKYDGEGKRMDNTTTFQPLTLADDVLTLAKAFGGNIGNGQHSAPGNNNSKFSAEGVTIPKDWDGKRYLKEYNALYRTDKEKASKLALAWRKIQETQQ